MTCLKISKVLLYCMLAAIANGNILDKPKARFDHFKVLRVEIPDEKALRYVSHPEPSNLYDIWAEPRIGQHSDIMVSPENMMKVERGLNEMGLLFSTMIANVQVLIDLENRNSAKLEKTKPGHPMTWTEYHSQDDMEEYMDYLAETYSDMVSIESIGTSYEGRPMRVLKICKGGTCGNKPAMWIDGGIHAREWISPATATYHMRELVENGDQYPSELLDKLDWYILPVHNPDGYDYTRTDYRMWRKNRTPNSGSNCLGTDMNRNYGYMWNHGGTSNDPCSDTYHGKAANSEPEVQNVENFVSKIKDKVKFYNSLHSYSQLILLPWGYTEDDCPNHDNMMDVANEANKALLAQHGKIYDVGCIPCLLYIASGNAVDYAKGELEIPYVYTIELRDTGHYGFLLPPDQIIPTGEEIMAFHVSAAQRIIEEFGAI